MNYEHETMAKTAAMRQDAVQPLPHGARAGFSPDPVKFMGEGDIRKASAIERELDDQNDLLDTLGTIIARHQERLVFVLVPEGPQAADIPYAEPHGPSPISQTISRSNTRLRALIHRLGDITARLDI